MLHDFRFAFRQLVKARAFTTGGNHCACAPDWRECGHLQPDDIRDRNSVLSALLIQAKRIFLPLFLT
jgi:hypothetical protein